MNIIKINVRHIRKAECISKINIVKGLIVLTYIFIITGNIFAQSLIPQTASGMGKITFSPDGKTFAASSSGYTIKLWNYESLLEIGTFAGHTDYIYSLNFSPDGKALLSCSDDNTVRIWDVSSQKEMQKINIEGVRAAAFGSNARQIITASRDKTVKMRDLDNNEEILSVDTFTEYIQALLYDPELQYIIFSDSNRIEIFNTGTKSIEKTFYHNGNVSSLAISPDKRYLISGSKGGMVGVWYLTEDDSFLLDTEHNEEITSVGISGDSKLIFSLSDEKIAVWDLSQRKLLLSIPGNKDETRYYAVFSPDSKRIITAHGNNRNMLTVWDASDGREITSIKANYDRVKRISLNAAGNIIAVLSGDNTVRIWNLIDGNMIKLLQCHSDSIDEINFSPDGERIIYGSDSRIYIWDWKNDNKIMSYYAYAKYGVSSISYSPDGESIISSGFGHIVKLWNAKNGTSIWAKIHNDNWGTIVTAFSNNGKYIASANESIQIRNVKTGELVKKLVISSEDNSNYKFCSLVFSDDDTYLFSGSNKIILWDFEKGTQIKTFSEHEGTVTALSISQGGQKLASGSSDTTIILWNIEDGSFQKYTGHERGIDSVYFTSGGKGLVSASSDSVRVWDCKSGAEIIKFIGFSDGEWACITPDGYYNASEAALDGGKYLAAVSGTQLYDMAEYKRRFYRPDIITERLRGIQ